jgi:hypothetical protein
MAEARVRGSYVKLAVACVKTLPPELRDAVFEELGAARAEIRAAGLLEWIPLSTYTDVIGASYRALGGVGCRNFWCAVMESSFERALMKPLVAAALRLYGRNPGSLLRMTPRALALVWLDLADDVRWNDGERRIEFENLTPALRRSDGVVDAFAGSAMATISYLKLPGSVTAHDRELHRGRLELDVRWQH